MDLNLVTPLVLTFNEHENIARCLDALKWAAKVLIVDSGSTDDTVEICRRYSNVTVIENPFVSFAEQANFGLSRLATKWVLSLDADYILSQELIEELQALSPEPETQAYAASFRYQVFGKSLRGSLYPPRTVLFHLKDAHYFDDGHSQRIEFPGRVETLREVIYHDDRKPISRWLKSQCRYAELEADKLSDPILSRRRLTDRIRRRKYFAPFLNLLWCLVVKGTFLEGPAGWYYSFQRLTAELMISICLLDRELRKKSDL